MKMKVGKTKLIKKSKNVDVEPEQPEERPNRIIAGKTKLISKAQKLKQQPKNDTPASEFLMEKISLTFFTDRWLKQLKTIQYSSKRPDKKRKNFKIFMSKITQSFTYHQYLYLMELFNRMSNLPKKSGVMHDPNYGKISIYTQEKPKKTRIPGARNPKKNAELEKYENENENDEIVAENEEKEEKNLKIRGKPKKINRRENNENDDVIEAETGKEEKNVIIRGFPKKNNKIENNENNESEDEDDIRYNTIELERQKICITCINRKEVQENIRKLMEENPDKDIDVDRIMRSKRLQYKMRNPWTNPIINKFYVCDYVRKVETYKGRKNDEYEKDKAAFVQNKSKVYTDNVAGQNWKNKKNKNTKNYYQDYYEEE